MNEIATIDDGAVWRPSAALNPQRLEYLWQLTEKIAFSTSVPESLRGERKGSNSFEPFDERTVLANVFAVVEQADRWNISPFALLSAAAIVRGKLTFEGKVIAAVMEAQFGVKLHAYYRGTPRTDEYRVYLCDEELPDDILAELKPGYRHDKYRILDGSVGEWKTTGNGSPWRPNTYSDMLVYRGVRQWARVYKSAAILGVLADDEIETFALEHAAQSAKPIAQRFSPPAKSEGFSPDNVTRALEHNPQQSMEIIDRETGEVIEVTNTEAQSASPGNTPTSGRKESGPAASPASDEPSSSPGPRADGDDGRAGSAAVSGTQPDNSSPAATGDASGGDSGSASFQAVSAATLRLINTKLARFTSEETVKKGYAQLCRENGLTKDALSPDDAGFLKSIVEAHLGRAKGEVTIEFCLQAVDAQIAEQYGDAP